MKTTNSLTHPETLRSRKLQMFLMTILVSFIASCTTEEITPAFRGPAGIAVESSAANSTGVASKNAAPGGSKPDYHCQYLRDLVNKLLDEYKDSSTTTKRRDAILKQLREIGEVWRNGGCQSAYGDITILFPKGPLTPPKAAPTGGVVFK